MNTVDKIRHEFEGMMMEYERLREKKIKKAGANARKHAMNLKKLMTPFRNEIQDMVKKVPKKR